MSEPRYCRRGHEIIAGVTAYAVRRWVGGHLFETPDGFGVVEGCDGGWTGQRRCKYGWSEEHRALEGSEDQGGTRVVGVDQAGRTIWQHRVLEWRCRECNRLRVAATRARRRAVMGTGTATNYAPTP